MAIENLARKRNIQLLDYGDTDAKRETSQAGCTNIFNPALLVNFIPKTILEVIEKQKVAESEVGSQDADVPCNEKKSVDEIDGMTIEDARNLCRGWKTSSMDGYMADLVCGLYSQISLGNKKMEVTPLYVNRDGTNEVYAWRIKLSSRQIMECMLSIFLDKSGKIRHGYAEILKRTALKKFDDFIYGKEASHEFLYFSCGKLGRCDAVKVHKAEKNIVELDISRKVFPFSVDKKSGNPNKVAERYITNITGIKSVLEVGRVEVSKKHHGERVPNTLTALRYYYMLSAAFQFQVLFGVSRRDIFDEKYEVRFKDGKLHYKACGDKKEHVLVSTKDKNNFIKKNRTKSVITIGTATASELFPDEIRRYGNDEYRIKSPRLLQRKIYLLGEILLEGLWHTGLIGMLKRSGAKDDIMIPILDETCNCIDVTREEIVIYVRPIKFA